MVFIFNVSLFHGIEAYVFGDCEEPRHPAEDIVERLTFGLGQKWREKTDITSECAKREVTIEDIAECIETKARLANHPVFGNITSDLKNNVVNDDLRKKSQTRK